MAAPTTSQHRHRFRAVLVEDSPGFRTVLHALLRARCDVTVVAEASDGAQGLARVREHAPDVVITDFQMPITDGIEMTRTLRGERPDVPVIMLTGFPGPELMAQAFEAGVTAFLDKGSAVDQLPALLREVLEPQRPERVTTGEVPVSS